MINFGQNKLAVISVEDHQINMGSERYAEVLRESGKVTLAR
jgi:hypothetical protein